VDIFDLEMEYKCKTRQYKSLLQLFEDIREKEDPAVDFPVNTKHQCSNYL